MLSTFRRKHIPKSHYLSKVDISYNSYATRIKQLLIKNIQKRSTVYCSENIRYNLDPKNKTSNNT